MHLFHHNKIDEDDDDNDDDNDNNNGIFSERPVAQKQQNALYIEHVNTKQKRNRLLHVR